MTTGLGTVGLGMLNQQRLDVQNMAVHILAYIDTTVFVHPNS